MNEEFAQWVYNRAFYIIRHPNDFSLFQRNCAQVVYDWYSHEYLINGDKSRYVPDGSIEIVCGAFDYQDACGWIEPDFGNEPGGYNPFYAYIGDLYECKADILSDLQELRAAGECESVADLDQEQDEYLSPRDYDHDLDADLTYYEGAGVL